MRQNTKTSDVWGYTLLITHRWHYYRQPGRISTDVHVLCFCSFFFFLCQGEIHGNDCACICCAERPHRTSDGNPLASSYVIACFVRITVYLIAGVCMMCLSYSVCVCALHINPFYSSSYSTSSVRDVSSP